MDLITDAMEMVDHLHHPAFCVRQGIIVKVNPAGAARMIEAGTAVADILQTGHEEYTAFRSGCLYLSLRLGTDVAGASVTAKKDFHLFVLEPESEQSELRALALAARELREPLTGIMITTDRLFPKSVPETAEKREMMGRINRELHQMLRLISNMSDAAGFCTDSGARQEIRDIRSIICETVEAACSLAESTGITFAFQAVSEPVFGLVDAPKLERAIYNMISNALKFTPDAGTVEISLRRRKSMLSFSVQDSGCGVADNLRSSIFSRYCREPGVEDGRHGLGLGLVLVRSAAALHGGTVLIDQPENSGTRITMTLQIRESAGMELRSPVLRVDYAGERDHRLLELSDSLPAELYGLNKI